MCLSGGDADGGRKWGGWQRAPHPHASVRGQSGGSGVAEEGVGVGVECESKRQKGGHDQK